MTWNFSEVDFHCPFHIPCDLREALWHGAYVNLANKFLRSDIFAEERQKPRRHHGSPSGDPWHTGVIAAVEHRPEGSRLGSGGAVEVGGAACWDGGRPPRACRRRGAGGQGSPSTLPRRPLRTATTPPLRSGCGMKGCRAGKTRRRAAKCIRSSALLGFLSIARPLDLVAPFITALFLIVSGKQ